MSKENFKLFARNHPELISSVMNGSTSWQRLYELYDIYGDNSDIWSKYITSTSDVSFKEVFNKVKNIDMDSFQKGIDNLQKTIGMRMEEITMKMMKMKCYSPTSGHGMASTTKSICMIIWMW